MGCGATCSYKVPPSPTSISTRSAVGAEGVLPGISGLMKVRRVAPLVDSSFCSRKTSRYCDSRHI
jgi:hypothetical protein